MAELVQEKEKLERKSQDSPTTEKVSTVESGDDQWDYAREKRLVAKLDYHVIPWVMLLYLFSFLDRVNIGNARLYGLEEDLGMTGSMYQISVSVLFITYLAFEIPSNLVLKKFRPSRWIAFITVCWGIIATLTGVIKSYKALLALRLLLGMFEAGLFPGMTVYLTFFYTRKELALRIGYLFVSSALAGATGGLLAYAIGHMEGVAGLRGWRWIMILEGIPTVIIGCLTPWMLADNPEHAKFLTPDEQEFMRIRRLRETGETKNAQEFHFQDMRKAFLDWKVYLFAAGLYGMDTMLYGFSTFLPTIIRGLGTWTAPEVQALTIPCYCLGAVTYLCVARLSDKLSIRGPFAVFFGLVSATGYAILASDVANGVRYFGCFLVAMGLYVAVGIPLSWLANNCPRYGKRTTASGIQLTTGNSAGVAAPFLYVAADGPRYLKGQVVSASLVAFASCIYLFLFLWFRRENTKRDEEIKTNKSLQERPEEEFAELGDESPYFRYMT